MMNDVAARMTSAPDQSKPVMRPWLRGTTRTWPEEPPALPMPR